MQYNIATLTLELVRAVVGRVSDNEKYPFCYIVIIDKYHYVYRVLLCDCYIPKS